MIGDLVWKCERPVDYNSFRYNYVSFNLALDISMALEAQNLPRLRAIQSALKGVRL